ncbi:MAG: hypothetical protein ACE5D4_07235 [Thermodesulfobacteriota bacterium]
MRSGNVLGSVYRCPICGAELSVIRPGRGHLSPICCNKKMELLETVKPVYCCQICKCEVMHVVVKAGGLRPACCNQPMESKGVGSKP